jgi:hypothetical protein
MNKRYHIRLWILATGVWAGFLALGLPDYYQQYSSRLMLGFEVALVLPFSIVLYVVLKRAPARRRMSLARWIAFYFTVPLAVYDYLYCGLVLGRGVGFLWEFWYLTVYYVIPWVLAPAMAALASIPDNSSYCSSGDK